MPRITAATVAEHHTQQRRALLDAARAILASTGKAPTMSEVGRRAGLARSSVYQHFASPDELLEAIVADVFPDWAACGPRPRPTSTCATAPSRPWPRRCHRSSTRRC
jgi:AcrR family transcriptional regulator